MPSILVADDDTDLLEMVSAVLSSFDMEVHCIDKGAALLPGLSSLQPDIILMDIYLGDADGRKLCYELKTSEQFSGIPVILYSAGVISETSVQESLADDFMVKPFDIGELVARIQALVR